MLSKYKHKELQNRSLETIADIFYTHADIIERSYPYITDDDLEPSLELCTYLLRVSNLQTIHQDAYKDTEKYKDTIIPLAEETAITHIRAFSFEEVQSYIPNSLKSKENAARFLERDAPTLAELFKPEALRKKEKQSRQRTKHKALRKKKLSNRT